MTFPYLFPFSALYGPCFAAKIVQLTSVNAGSPPPFSEGILGNLVTSITGLSIQHVSNMDVTFQQSYNYVSVFAHFGVVTMAVGLLVLFLSPIIKNYNGWD